MRVLELTSTQDDIRRDVASNYWDNRWWPREVRDWRLKILLAGLSTRVSYNAIEVYQRVRDALLSRGFHGLASLSKQEFQAIIAPLGLVETRWALWQSILAFAARFPDGYEEPDELRRLDNDGLVHCLRANIHGVGSKVAQCSVLYIRGYQCGIVPVDSGMKDLLGTCLGFDTRGRPDGHESMRKEIQALTRSVDFRALLHTAGYDELADGSCPDTWWVHLVLIYFKRRYCNLRASWRCPLGADGDLRQRMHFTCCNSQRTHE